MVVPKPKKQPSGNWFVRLRLGGQNIPITAPTEKECANIALRIKTDYITNNKKTVSKTNITLYDVCENYINQYNNVLSPSTIRGYMICLRNRFKAYQKMPIDKIPWQKMINDELKMCSEKTVKNAWGLVHAALDFAEIEIPKVKLASAPVKEIAFLEPEEILQFCEAVKGRSYEIPALLALNGLRVSEIRGLTWKNIDLKRGFIHVRGAYIPGVNGHVKKETNKNAASTRDVPILIPQLHDALLNADKTGSMIVSLSEQNMLRDVKRACRRAGITEVTTHGLRHSFASLGYYLKIPERQLMQWGGWANYHTMHKIYIRVSALGESESRNAVTNFFEKRQ